MPGERAPGGAPVYKRRADAAWGGDVWLFLASTNGWIVSDTENKDARKGAGWMYNPANVAPGTLPHEAPAGNWELNVVSGESWILQPSISMTRLTKIPAPAAGT